MQHSKEYLAAIESTKGDEKLKKLAAQIISKFFKHFPALQIKAIDAIFDMCEDENASVSFSVFIFCKTKHLIFFLFNVGASNDKLT